MLFNAINAKRPYISHQKNTVVNATHRIYFALHAVIANAQIVKVLKNTSFIAVIYAIGNKHSICYWGYRMAD